ncbi:MAG: outer membrane protein assembly factor BamD [Candidatus Binatia bacterium]
MKATRLAVFAIAVSFIGCAAKKHLTADQDFHEASDSFRTGAFSLAVEQFHELLDQYPFSQYNEEAELKIAHAHYLSGSYAEAIVAFTDFQRRHPTSPHLPFVGYYLGMCYAKQMSTIDRDQGAAQNAQNVLLTLIQQYPDSPFADLAREQLARCRKSLADHELYIAKYYAQHDKSKAAEIRLLTLAYRYSDTAASADGLLRLAKLYRHGKRDDQALLAYRALERMHPRSVQATAARRALDRLKNAADQPPEGDPLDVLLAANGRQRGSSSMEVVQVPGLEPARTARRPASAPAAGLMPPFDPFGRGRPY